MYPIPSSEHLVEIKKCRKCTGEFPITDKDMEFYEKVSPTFPSWGVAPWNGDGVVAPKKYLIPPPTLCPDCRQQRRLAFRNERKLYKRKCDATGNDIISIYSPDKPYTVYHQDYWWSDAWDPMTYGREFDLSRSAFEQFNELMREVPRPSLLNASCENSEYTNYSSYLKDSYLVFDATQSDAVLFWSNLEFVQNSADMSDSKDCENCYNLLDCGNCNNVWNGWGCNWSHDCRYVEDLENAHHCFLSHTIYNKSYIFENIQCTQEGYEEKVKAFYALPWEKQREKVQSWTQEYRKTKVYPYHLSVRFENSTGYGFLNVKNATDCYSIQESEDIKYASNSVNLKHCSDVESVWEWAELCYEVNAALRMYKVCFWFWAWWENLTYCDHVSWSNNCFLCIWLRNKSYCILNRQYTKEEYESLVPRIIEKMMVTPLRQGFEGQMEWGEFFPASMSPFGYNETVAQEYFPLSREEVLGKTPLKGGDAEWNEAEGVGLEKSDSNPPVSPLSGDRTMKASFTDMLSIGQIMKLHFLRLRK